MSRKSNGGAGRTNVLEGDLLNLSDDTASRCSALRTGESDRPLEGITKPALEGVGSFQDGNSCSLGGLDVEI